MDAPIQHIDSQAGWQHAQKVVDAAVKSGHLDTERAHRILKESRESYRENKLNRMADKVNAGLRNRK